MHARTLPLPPHALSTTHFYLRNRISGAGARYGASAPDIERVDDSFTAAQPQDYILSSVKKPKSKCANFQTDGQRDTVRDTNFARNFASAWRLSLAPFTFAAAKPLSIIDFPYKDSQCVMRVQRAKFHLFSIFVPKGDNQYFKF